MVLRYGGSLEFFSSLFFNMFRRCANLGTMVAVEIP
jgi:hypothetical protein